MMNYNRIINQKTKKPKAGSKDKTMNTLTTTKNFTNGVINFKAELLADTIGYCETCNSIEYGDKVSLFYTITTTDGQTTSNFELACLSHVDQTINNITDTFEKRFNRS